VAEAGPPSRGREEGEGVVSPELIAEALAALKAKVDTVEASAAEHDARGQAISQQASDEWDLFFKAKAEVKRLNVLIEALEALS
jgi:hypothetical protein